MDFGFEGFDSSDFDVEIEDVVVKKVKKFDRMWKVGTGGSVCAKIFIENGIAYVAAMDHHVYAIDAESGEELWRYKTGGLVGTSVVHWNGKIFFGSWDCHVYCVDLKTREEVWRFATSSSIPATIPPPYDAFSAEIKKETHIDDSIGEKKYKSKKEETVSLSDYHTASEYSATSDYKTKSDYDTSFVIFGSVMETEEPITDKLTPFLLFASPN